MESQKKKKLVNSLMDSDVLISADFFTDDNYSFNISDDTIKSIDELDIGIINNDIINLIHKNIKEANWSEIDRVKTLAEKEGKLKGYDALINSLIELNKKGELARFGSEVIFSYNKEIKKKTVDSFVSYFNNRYRSIEKIITTNHSMKGLTAIGRIKGKKDRESISLVAMVTEKRMTAKGNIILTVEDPTGFISILFNNNNVKLFEKAKEIVVDEVLGITGATGDNIIFGTQIYFPDIKEKEILKSPTEEYAVFLSDLHIGSRFFLEREFSKFIDWLNGNIGNDTQKELTKKIKYVFFAGDMVDGIGIYPNQEKELSIKDIYEQYDEAFKFFSRIPNDKQIIIAPGNHDATRLSEPQLALIKKYTEKLASLPNVLMVSNPSMINIGKREDFKGFDVLLYHGYSFDYYIANVDSIRNNGGYDRADLVQKFLLKKRHLAPSHTSTLYIPDTDDDPLMIKEVPDIFFCGHMHKSCIGEYKGVSLIAGPCFQSTTGFQEKMGHSPDPARVPIMNLKTREMKIMRFS